MCDLLRDCERMSWQEALERAAIVCSRPSRFLEYAGSPCRASWWPLLNLQPDWRVLDLGCGWGAIAAGLALRVASVVACDLSQERLRFLQARCLQDGISNLQLVCAGDTPRLPFADQEFDLVVLNDVLSWVPLAKPGPAKDAEKAFLLEAGRVLASNGQLLLAEQNRLRLGHKTGLTLDWSDSPSAGLQPGAAGDPQAKRRSGAPYQAHKLSFAGQKRLLRSTGFSSRKALILLPNFQSFHTIFDPKRKETADHYFARRGPKRFESIRLKFRASLSPLLASDFCWIASRAEPQTSFLESLGQHIAQTLYGLAKAQIEYKQFRISAREVITCELKVHWALPNIIVKMPLTAAAESRLASEQNRLTSLRVILRSPAEWPEIPKPLYAGGFRDTPFFVLHSLPGLAGIRFLRSCPRANALKQLALDFIVRLHRATQNGQEFDVRTWNEEFMPVLEPALELTQQRVGIHAQRIREALVQEFVGHPWPLVFGHGDYWAGNLLFDRRGHGLSGVIDWDCALPRSLPLLDLLNFLLSARAELAQTRDADVYGRALARGVAPEDGRTLDAYLERMGFHVNARQMQVFLLLTWLLRISRRVSPRQSIWWSKSQWIRENVDPSGAWLKEVLGGIRQQQPVQQMG